MERFVYVLDDETVATLLPDWPEGIQLALCLAADGTCDAVVHHRGELAQVLGRLSASVSGAADPAGGPAGAGAAQALCVAPPVPGYPTRRVLFSEEQQLLALVAEMPQLAEMAADHAINHGFARDAAPHPAGPDAPAAPGAATFDAGPGGAIGRDPAPGGAIAHDRAPGGAVPRDSEPGGAPRGLGTGAAPREPGTGAAPRDPGTGAAPPGGARDGQVPPKPAGAAGAPRGAAPPGFVTHLSLPAGYAAPKARTECLFLDGRLEGAGATVRLTVAPGAATGAEPARAVDRLGCRDDFARFVLPRALLDGWAPGQAARLDIPADLFPEALAARYLDRPHRAEITVTRRGVFVTPGAPIGPAAAGAAHGDTPARRAPDRRAPARRAPARRAPVRPLHAAVAALVAVLLLSGHFATAFQPGGPGQPAPGGAEAALNLIAAMAASAAP